MRNLRLKRFIANGGVVAYPTESCFGLGCDPQSFRGIKKLNTLKKRPSNRNFILITSDPVSYTHLTLPTTPYV